MYNGHLSIEEIEQLIQQKGPAENQTHVESCQQCRSMLEDCQAVCAKLEKLASVPIGAERAMKCPDERIWFDVAAGTLPAEESLQHIQHAAECSSCGQRLKTASRMFEEELSEQEERAVGSMAISQQGAQDKLATSLASLSKPIEVHKGESGGRSRTRKLFWRIPSWAFAVGVALFAFLGFQAYRFVLIQEARKDIRQKYADGRPMEYRVAGMPYGRVRLKLGGTSLLASTEVPANSGVVLAAQAALLARDSESAVRILEAARRADDNSLPVLDILIVAYALEAERTGLKTNYNMALTLSDEILSRGSKDPVVYFNRALIFVQLSRPEEAKSAFGEAIRFEPEGDWADEAKERLRSLQ